MIREWGGSHVIIEPHHSLSFSSSQSLSPQSERKPFDSSGTRHFLQFGDSWASPPQNHRGQLARVVASAVLNYLVGVTLLETLDAGPGPALFVAVTVKV